MYAARSDPLSGHGHTLMNLKSPRHRELIKLQGWAGVAARVIYIFIYTYRLYREGDFTLLKKCWKQESGARHGNFSAFVYSDRPFYTILKRTIYFFLFNSANGELLDTPIYSIMNSSKFKLVWYHWYVVPYNIVISTVTDNACRLSINLVHCTVHFTVHW